MKEVVLISGCSSGIGLALAREFRERGCRVFASARREDSLAQLREQGFETVQLDITDDHSVKHGVNAVLEAAGRIDCLVNNAGHSLFGPLAEIPLEEVRRLLDTNVLAQIRLCQAVIPTMACQGSGKIVNVGSTMGLVTTPFVGAYSATKAGFHLLSDSLRMEVEPFGVSVTVVQPGAVQSEVAAHAVDHSGLVRYDHPDSLYYPVRDQIRIRAMASQDGPQPAADFARQVVGKLLRDKPPRVIRAGAGHRLLTLLSWLPGSLRDRLFSKRFKLQRLASR